MRSIFVHYFLSQLFSYFVKIIQIPHIIQLSLTGCTEARAQELLAATSRAIFTHVAGFMSHQHFLIFVTFIAFERMLYKRQTNPNEIDAFIKGLCKTGASMPEELPNINSQKLTWMSTKVFREIVFISK